MSDGGSKEKRGKSKKDIDCQPTCPIRLDWSRPETQASDKTQKNRSGKGICRIRPILPLPVRRPSRMSTIRRMPNMVVARPALSHSLFSRLRSRRPRFLSLRHNLFLHSPAPQYDGVPLTFESPGDRHLGSVSSKCVFLDDCHLPVAFPC